MDCYRIETVSISAYSWLLLSSPDSLLRQFMMLAIVLSQCPLLKGMLLLVEI